MTVEPTALEGLKVVRPTRFSDARGWFMETYHQERFAQLHATGFVQDNLSYSHRGVLRGLHFQATPHAQAKLVSVLRGAVLDVCVDIRPQSSTFGQHVRMELTAIGAEMLYIPEGFAHGFVALENDTLFHYKCGARYEPSAERTLIWNDPALGISWGVSDPLVSEKDRAGLTLDQLFPDRSTH
jgi:dTDP-4-dehydrorhamnose 3,5-epimerase